MRVVASTYLSKLMNLLSSILNSLTINGTRMIIIVHSTYLSYSGPGRASVGQNWIVNHDTAKSNLVKSYDILLVNLDCQNVCASVNSLSCPLHDASELLLMSAFIPWRIGIAKPRHKSWQRCVALLPSFLGLSFFTRQRIWQTVSHQIYPSDFLNMQMRMAIALKLFLLGLLLMAFHSGHQGLQNHFARHDNCLKFATAPRSWGVKATWEGDYVPPFFHWIHPIGWL